ncbi:MAG TPA: adenylate/guanylate cyclase domain-containing protein, partial [Treponemataceae bacterium]|nr:adenylate/guanylate cyclase domain-containing protein [Treponemataceae bacterium]
MKSIKTIIASILLFCFLLFCIASLMLSNPLYNKRYSKNIESKNAWVDLSTNAKGINQIRSAWSFAWKEFIPKAEHIPTGSYADLPGTWKNIPGTSRFGWASWGLTVTGLEQNRMYAIRIGQTHSACKIFINGEESYSIGVPGTSIEEEKPEWGSVLCRFTSTEFGTASIVLQISNFHDRTGGITSSIVIGDAELLYRMEDNQRLVEGLIFGILVIMGAFFCALYAFRAQESQFIWFALLCFVAGLRSLCYDGFTLLYIIPSLPWTVFFRLGYLTFPLAIVTFLLFLQNVFPELISLKRTHFLLIPSYLYLFIIAVFPEIIITLLLSSIQIYSLFIAVYGLSIIILACKKSLTGSWWLLIGFVFAIFSFIYDVFVSLLFISGISISSIGMNVCLFCIALMVIERYANSFKLARSLRRDLLIINQSLKRFVPLEVLAFLKKDSVVDVEPGQFVEQVMTILSADIRSFSQIAEKMTGDEVFVFLNEYFELLLPIIHKHGGFIVKYSGEGILVVFSSGGEAALNCAVQMQSAIGSWNRTKRSGNPISVGIGIDLGKISLATVGDETRLGGTVFSKYVKSALQFEAQTKRYNANILINENVVFALPDPHAWFMRPVDRIVTDSYASFLFEVYNNDPEELRELKWKTQSDLEKGVYAWHAKQYEEA